jgi:DNA repair protein RecO (recombination protein O)
VLRRRELGENDLLVTLFTPEKGRFQAVARSSRKVAARLMGKLEPTMEIDLSLAQGKSLDVVTEVRVRETRPQTRGDLDRLAYALVLLELFEVVDAPGETWPLLSATLTLLEAGADAATLLAWCEIQLVESLGLAPEMAVCVACRGPRTTSFSVRQGGLLCATCSGRDDNAWAVVPGTVAFYRQLRGAAPALLPRLSAEPLVRRQLEEVMRSHLSYRWPHRLRSLDFLAQVERMRR